MLELTKSNEDYLEAIGLLSEKSGTAQVRDIAEMLKVKMPSVTSAVKQLADMGLEQVPVPTIEDKPGLSALGASDIRTVNDSLARFDASVEHFKQTALDAEKKLKKARAGQSAAKADALLNEWLSDDPASLIQVAEGAGELLQELLNGLKKRQYAGAAFLLCVDSSSLLLGAYCGKDAIADGLSAGDMVREVSALAGGKGGGRPDQARGSAGCRSPGPGCGGPQHH